MEENRPQAQTTYRPPNPAFVFPQDKPGTIISDKYERAGGMQLRDYFAAQAMPGVQVQGENLVKAVMDAAQIAYALADAMLIVRDLAPIIVPKAETLNPKAVE